jgi:hypothetical protein
MGERLAKEGNRKTYPSAKVEDSLWLAQFAQTSSKNRNSVLVIVVSPTGNESQILGKSLFILKCEWIESCH